MNTNEKIEITKTTTPADIEKYVDHLIDVMSKSNIAHNRTELVEQMTERAAATHGLDVPTWKQSFAPPAPAAKKKNAKPAAPVTRESVKQRLAGASTKVDPDYFWISEENQAIGKTWMALRRDAGVVMNMMAVGPSGCGKTEGLERLAQEFGVPFYKIDCAAVTTPDKWSGHKEVIATEQGPQTQFVKSEHLRWLAAEDCEPGIVVYDEINRLPGPLLNTLIPILDGSQRLWVPDMGIYSHVHPDTMIAATANLGVGYTGTFGLDIALDDRFGVVLEQTFPPVEEEATILVKRTGLDGDRAKKLVAVATSCRAKAHDQSLSRFVSTRALIDWSRWVTTGMSMTQAAEATFVKKFSDDGGAGSERSTVRMILQGVCNGQ